MQSITQVFGLLFGNGDNDEHMEGKVRKRGRPVKYVKDKRPVSIKSSSSVDSDLGNDSEQQRRKRGRPKGTFKIKPRVRLVPPSGFRELNNLGDNSKSFAGTSFMKRKEVRSTRSSSCSDEDSEFDSENDMDGGWGHKSSFARRSRRNKPLDPTKDLIVLRPSDDPVLRLGIGANEIGEFTVCMEEQGGKDDFEEQGAQHDPHDPIIIEGAEVHTPGVSLILNQFKRDDGLSPKRNDRNKLNVSIKNPSLAYTDYEADSDDETFVSDLKKKYLLTSSDMSSNRIKVSDDSLERANFSCYWFQKMFSILEREMELSKSYLPLSFEEEDIRNDLEEFVESSEEVLEIAKNYLNDENNGSYIDIQDYIEEFPPLKNTEQKRIGSENHLQSLIRGNSMLSMKSDDNPLKSEENTWNSNRTAAIASLAYLNLSSNDSLSSIHNFNCKREWTTHFGVTRKSLETDPILFTYYTVDQLRKLVPEDRALSLLSELLNQAYSSSTQSPFVEKAQVCRTSAETQKKAFLLAIYNFWVDKRSKRRISLLRCYHNFIMDNWHQQTDCIPSLVEDEDAQSLENSHTKLLRLRRDLDRARLIMDRVRRREKVKKDLIRIAREGNISNVDNRFTLDTVNYDQLAEAQTNSGNSKGNLETPVRKSGNTDRRNVDNDSHWVVDEDKLLLLGISNLGAGRWNEIRDEYCVERNSIQMNQRFTILIQRRSSGNSKYLVDEPVVSLRKQLNKKVLKQLDDFDEDKVWEGIALKYLADTTRSGRTSKYPLPIPIPKHLQPALTKAAEPVKVRVHHNQHTKRKEREELERLEKERLAALNEVKVEPRKWANQYSRSGEYTKPVRTGENQHTTAARSGANQHTKARSGANQYTKARSGANQYTSPRTGANQYTKARTGANQYTKAQDNSKKNDKQKEIKGKENEKSQPPVRRDQNGRFVSLKNKSSPSSSSKNNVVIILDKGSSKRGTDLSEKEIEKMNKAHFEMIEMKTKEQKSEREKRARLREIALEEEEPPKKHSKVTPTKSKKNLADEDIEETPNNDNSDKKLDSSSKKVLSAPLCSLGSLSTNKNSKRSRH